jgi:hypothetical protein
VRSFFWVALMTLGGGLLAYFGVSLLTAEVKPKEFANLIGLVAIVSGLAGWGLSKHQARRGPHGGEDDA